MADQDLYLFKLPNSRKINKGFEQAFELPRSWDQEEIVEHFEALEMILNNEKGISKLVRAADGLKKTKTACMDGI